VTFLDLVKRLAQESGTADPDEITVVASLTGHERDMRDWVNQAWREIQLAQDQWRWMQKTGVFNMTIGQSEYTKTQIQAQIPDYDEPIAMTAPRDYRYVLIATPGGQTNNQCWYYPWETYRGLYDRWVEEDGQPQRFTLKPNESLVFDPAPQQAYQVDLEYKQSIQDLTASTTVPDMPEKYHMLIVYWALIFYSGYDEASSRYQSSERLYRMMMQKLCNEQLPEYQMVGA